MKKIDFTPVKSSQIKGIHHENGTLYIKFKNGKIYSYSPVNKDGFEEFKNSDSLGKYFHSHIKMNSELKIQHENIEIK